MERAVRPFMIFQVMNTATFHSRLRGPVYRCAGQDWMRLMLEMMDPAVSRTPPDKVLL